MAIPEVIYTKTYIPKGWGSAAPLHMSADYGKGGQSIIRNFFFDAVIRAEHSQELNITQHPVQIGTSQTGPGGSLSDHAYLLPSRLVLEIGISDAMDMYNDLSFYQYTTDKSKSVSAYKTFLDLQGQRIPIEVTTRLKVYKNMLIQSIRPVEDYRTKASLRAAIVFQEIIMGQVTIAIVSTDPQATVESTEKGNVSPKSTPPAMSKNKVPASVTSKVSSPGAGTYSSQFFNSKTFLLPGWLE